MKFLLIIRLNDSFYMGNIHSIWTSMVAKRGNWMNEKCEWERGKVSAASEEFNEAYILSLKGNYGSFFLLLCHTRTRWWKWRAPWVKAPQKSTCWKVKFIVSHESFSIIIFLLVFFLFRRRSGNWIMLHNYLWHLALN